MVLTLALGIGATVSVFSIIHAVMITPLPYDDPSRLFSVFESKMANDEGKIIVLSTLNARLLAQLLKHHVRQTISRFRIVSAVHAPEELAQFDPPAIPTQISGVRKGLGGGEKKNPVLPEESWCKISSAVLLPPIKTCFVMIAKEHCHGNC